jgi:hypothetical protein
MAVDGVIAQVWLGLSAPQDSAFLGFKFSIVEHSSGPELAELFKLLKSALIWVRSF